MRRVRSHRTVPERLLFPARPLFEARPLLEDFYVLGALSGLVVLLASWGHPLWGASWGAYCPFRALTDIPCPTCYGTRAMLAATSGRWFAALRLNPLVASGGIGLFAYLPWAVGTVVGGWPRPRLSPRFVAKAGWVGAGLVLANWIYLIVARG